MAFSLLILVYIYYPVFLMYFFPPSLPKNMDVYNFSLEIPSLHIFSPVFTGIDPYNANVYRKVLEKGIAQAKGTGLPGQGKTIFLFAHSSDAPWNITRYNTIFYRLPELKNGAEVVIRKDKKVYKYKVFAERTVWPSQIQYLKKDSGNILILQTCTPVGTDWQRLLVFARPV